MLIANPSTHLRAPRVTRIAACLAVALATGSAGALAIAAGDTSAGAFNNRALLGDQVSSVPGDGANRHRAGAARPTSVTRPAALVPVTNCDDTGPGSLREAATNAANGDVIDMHLLTCSPISLTSGAIEINAEDVTLLGPGRDVLTIDGNQNGYVLGSQTLSVTDLTIANGLKANGFAGCISTFGSLTLTRSSVTGCQAGGTVNANAYGAGVDVRGDLVMESSTISGSHALATEKSYGGGAYVDGTAYLYDSTISGSSSVTANDKSRGGGLFAKGVVKLYDSRILDNEVTSQDGTAYGGGIDTLGGVLVEGSTISGNSAQSDTKWSYGGGIQVGDNFGAEAGDITMYTSTMSGNIVSSNCDSCYIQGGGAHAFGAIRAWYSTITDNHVISAAASFGTAQGGGLSTFAVGTAGFNVLINSTMSGNSAMGGVGGNGNGGGMMTMQDSPLGLINSTIAFNRASTSGGGAVGGYASGTYASVAYSSIVANNEAPDGADLASQGPAFTITGNNNLVMSASADLTLPPDTLSADPKLLSLASYGGPTRTHALAACSPAINAGVNGFPGTALQWDQRGDPFVREFGAAPDIGAFELQPDTDVIFRNGFEGSPCP